MDDSTGAMRPLLAVCVGNSRTRFGRFERGELLESGVADNDDPSLQNSLDKLRQDAAVVLASVNHPVCEKLATAIGPDALRLGDEMPIKLNHTLEDASTLGQDRSLNALGAYAKAEQACVVVDAGTAVTVDFIDGQGTFHGGAIAPGVEMMLKALHQFTAALPAIHFEPHRLAEQSTPFGQDTPDAMLKGVVAAVRGMVRELTDRYADHYDAYPQVIATGGDAQSLFSQGDLIEYIVPDLQLVGVQEAVKRALEDDSPS